MNQEGLIKGPLVMVPFGFGQSEIHKKRKLRFDTNYQVSTLGRFLPLRGILYLRIRFVQIE